MEEPDIPKFKNYADGEPIPPVDPEDLRRRWKIPMPWTREALEAAWQLEEDISAVSSRDEMIRMLTHYNKGQLLAPWHQGEELHEAVFRIAATFPLRQLEHKSYMMTGDEHFGFDPNAFVQKLIEETGIAHVWEPIPLKLGEGDRMMTFLDDPENSDPVKHARHHARRLLWMIWERCCCLAPLVKGDTGATATLFADFVLDNIDLLHRLEEGFRNNQGGSGLPLLQEVERKAQNWPQG